MRGAVGAIAIALLLGAPALALRLSGTHAGVVADTVVYGLAIVAAAFLLSWAVEAAEVDISQALAVVVIAFVAVLPEYAVDLTFAWKAGQDPEFAPYAVANMTGANRLLIGLGWAAIFLIFWRRTGGRVLRLGRSNALDVAALAAASLYSLTIPLKGTIHLVDTLVLGAIFAAYMYGVARAPGGEPHLVGPSRWLGGLPPLRRRTVTAAIFVYSAAAILASAEPFAEGLVESGTALNIDEFLLVQWLAPLASESPEFLVAGILAFRGRAAVGLAALLSSKVNQWTLLVGALPVAHGISGGTIGGLPLDARQTGEVFLTAAQSMFAVAVLVNLGLGRREAAALFGLFAFQFFVPVASVRIAITILYLALAAIIAWRQRAAVRATAADARAVLRDPVLFAQRIEAEAADGAAPRHG